MHAISEYRRPLSEIVKTRLHVFIYSRYTTTHCSLIYFAERDSDSRWSFPDR